MLLNIILRVGKLNCLAHSYKRSAVSHFCWWKDACNLAVDNSSTALSNLFGEVPWQPVPSTTATDYGHSAGKVWRQGTQLGCQAWILHTIDWGQAGWSLGAKHISKHCLLLSVMNLLFCVSVSASTNQFKFDLRLEIVCRSTLRVARLQLSFKNSCWLSWTNACHSIPKEVPWVLLRCQDKASNQRDSRGDSKEMRWEQKALF